MEYIYHYSSPLGGITIASNGIEITGLWFDGQKYFADTLSKVHEEKALPVFDETRRLFAKLYGTSCSAFHLEKQ